MHDPPVGPVPRGKWRVLGQVARDEGYPFVGEIGSLVEAAVTYEGPVEHGLVELSLPDELVLELGPFGRRQGRGLVQGDLVALVDGDDLDEILYSVIRQDDGCVEDAGVLVADRHQARVHREVPEGVAHVVVVPKEHVDLLFDIGGLFDQPGPVDEDSVLIAYLLVLETVPLGVLVDVISVLGGVLVKVQ